jgi:hypothetical protein
MSEIWVLALLAWIFAMAASLAWGGVNEGIQPR